MDVCWPHGRFKHVHAKVVLLPGCITTVRIHSNFYQLFRFVSSGTKSANLASETFKGIQGISFLLRMCVLHVWRDLVPTNWYAVLRSIGAEHQATVGFQQPQKTNYLPGAMASTTKIMRKMWCVRNQSSVSQMIPSSWFYLVTHHEFKSVYIMSYVGDHAHRRMRSRTQDCPTRKPTLSYHSRFFLFVCSMILCDVV